MFFRLHGCSKKRVFLNYKQGQCSAVQSLETNTFDKISLENFLGFGRSRKTPTSAIINMTASRMITLKHLGGWWKKVLSKIRI